MTGETWRKCWLVLVLTCGAALLQYGWDSDEPFMMIAGGFCIAWFVDLVREWSRG